MGDLGREFLRYVERDWLWFAIVAFWSVVGLVRLFVGWRRRRLLRLAGVPRRAKTYLDLRQTLLERSLDKLEIAPPDDRQDVYGVLVDWGLEDGPMTIAAYLNGDIEVLAGSGFSASNDDDDPEIRAAAIALVKTAGRHIGAMRPAIDLPLPSTGNLIFYLLTSSGKFTAQESGRALASGSSPMSDIGTAMLRAYKLVEKAKEGQPPRPIEPPALTGPWSTV